MLFEETETQYYDGLIEEEVDDGSPKIPEQLQTKPSQPTIFNTLGMTRTSSGFQVKSPAPELLAQETYTGHGSTLGTNPWVPITSADIHILRSLGVEV